jgi:hypothetical protein
MKTEIFKGDGLLRGKTVFLSASKPSRDKDLFPVTEEAAKEIEEAVRALARAVFAEAGRLVFGAHPSISPLIVDVATEYFPPRWEGSGKKAEDHPPVVIYQSEVFKDVIPPATRALEKLGFAHIILTERQNGEEYDPRPPQREQYLQSLAHMRRRMFQETQPIAMVAAGGMQGVVREARLFLDMFKEGGVYALRTTGGAAERLPEYLSRNAFDESPLPAETRWRQRLTALEDRFGDSNWQMLRKQSAGLPRQPYALLMQKMVQEIAGVKRTG